MLYNILIITSIKPISLNIDYLSFKGIVLICSKLDSSESHNHKHSFTILDKEVSNI